jgi:hypothetical protein
VLGRVTSFSETLCDLISNLIAEIANRMLDIRERCWPKIEAQAAGLVEQDLLQRSSVWPITREEHGDSLWLSAPGSDYLHWL